MDFNLGSDEKDGMEGSLEVQYIDCSSVVGSDAHSFSFRGQESEVSLPLHIPIMISLVLPLDLPSVLSRCRQPGNAPHESDHVYFLSFPFSFISLFLFQNRWLEHNRD